MQMLMIIDTAHGGMYFSLTYLAAMLVASGMMIYTGLNKGYPRSTWLLILLTGVIFFIIGNKVFTYSPEQWTRVFTRFQFPMADKKTILGGIIGLFAGIFSAKTFLRFKCPVMDTIAIGLPVGMAISRIGCLMAGCCFGTPTHLPWGIEYGVASPAYHVHFTQGLVHMHDKYSLPIHPAQLYQLIGCLAIAFIVWKSRKQWKSDGSLFLFSVLCYGILRFFVEFVRAPETNYFTGQVFLGLKIIQWMIMAATLSGLLILIFRESKRFEALSDGNNHRKDTKTLKNTIFIFNFLPGRQAGLRLSALAVKERDNLKRNSSCSGIRKVLLLIILSMIVFSGRKWFDPLELSTIIVFLIPVIIAMAVTFYHRFSVKGFRWVAPVLLVCSFSFMAQKSSTTGSDDRVIFTSAGFIGTAGKYAEGLYRISGQYIEGGCMEPGYWKTDTNYIGKTSRTFYQGGIDFYYNKWKGKYKKLKFGGRLSIGSETGDIKEDHPSSFVFVVNPSIGMDWRWFGFNAGLAVGQMKLPLGVGSTNQHSGEIISSEYRNFYVCPTIDLRVGPYDIIYFDLGTPVLFPSTYDMFHMSIGSGLGKTDGRKLEIGMFDNGGYIKFAYPIKNKIVVEALYGDNFLSGIESERVVSIGASYRFFK